MCRPRDVNDAQSVRVCTCMGKTTRMTCAHSCFTFIAGIALKRGTQKGRRAHQSQVMHSMFIMRVLQSHSTFSVYTMMSTYMHEHCPAV